MAKGNLSFSVAINLLTEQFKKGTKDIQNGLRSIQMQTIAMVGALGAGGVGLTDFVSKMIDTAKKINQSTTVLKNTSGSQKQFGENQKFLIKLSKDYGLNINDLMLNFGKFTSTANSANMSIEDQYSLFEGLSKAVVNFGLSADDANGIFLAISQMISKGKVSAEELRGQLGERLPGAMQLMAKAAGVSVASLDDMMKQGKLISTEVLPKFATELNNTFSNVNTNTLNKSLGDLENNFTDLTKKMDVENIYKNMVNKLSELFKWIISNFASVTATIINIIFSVIIGKGINAIINGYKNLSANALVYYKMQAKMAGESFDQAAFNSKKFFMTMKFGFATLKAAAISAFAAIAPMLIISAITAIIQKLIEAKKKSDEIKNAYSDYQKKLNSDAKNNAQSKELKNQLSILNNHNNSLEDRKLALTEINKILGTNYKFDKNGVLLNEDINKKIKDRLKLYETEARYKSLTDQQLTNENNMSNYQASIDEDNRQISAYQKKIDDYNKNSKNLNPYSNEAKNAYNQNITDKENLKRWKNKLVEDTKAIAPYLKIDVDITKQKNKLEKDLNITDNNNSIITNDTNDKKTDIEKLDENYKKEYQQLINYTSQNKDKIDDNNKLWDDFNQKYKDEYEKAGNANQLKNNKNYQSALTGTNNKLFDENKSKYNEAIKNYTDELNLINKKEFKTQKDKDDAINNLIDSTIESIYTSNYFNDEVKKKVEELKGLKIKEKDLSKYENYKSKYSDVNLSSEEKLQNQFDSEVEKLNKLVDIAKSTGVDMADELNNQLSKVETLDDALGLLKARNQLKEFNKELAKSTYNGVKDIANNAINLVESFKSLKETMNDLDASEFEKLVALWSFLTQTIDGVLSVIQTIQTIGEAIKALTVASQTAQAVENTLTTQKLTNAEARIAANTAEAASGAAASVSAVPIVGVGLAIGAVAAIIGLLATLPKFANGGIVGGNSTTGDKILARLNAGELILNTSQQSTLYGLLNKSGGSGGEVKFIIEGKNLKGVLTNYDNIKNKAK